LVRLALVLALYFGVFRIAFIPMRVLGRSMEPGYRPGRPNLIYRLAYRSSAPRRGDVVVIQVQGSIQRVMKRIVALPGERVALRAGRVFVDGAPLEEPYARGNQVRSREVRLRPDEYFVAGDNRDVTEVGRVTRQDILGRVLY
jgi:signal peptidase I